MHMKHAYAVLVAVGALIALAVVPAGASAADCEFAWIADSGSSWDSDESSGDFYDGALLPVGAGIDYADSDLRSDAFDDYGIASIDGLDYSNPDTMGCSRDGRTNRFPVDEPVTDIKVRPELYVPKNRPLGRQLVTIRNVGATAVTFDFTFDGELGSDNYTNVAKSSSGNTTVNAADAWATSCEDVDADGCAQYDPGIVRDPELAHNWERTGKKPESADVVAFADGVDNLDVTFENVKLRPGQSKSFMEIVQMARTITGANKAVRKVEDGPRYLFAGLSRKERQRIQNW